MYTYIHQKGLIRRVTWPQAEILISHLQYGKPENWKLFRRLKTRVRPTTGPQFKTKGPLERWCVPRLKNLESDVLRRHLFGEGSTPVSRSRLFLLLFHPCASLSYDASHIQNRHLHSVPWPHCQSSLQNPHRQPKLCFSNSLDAPLFDHTDSQESPLPICHFLPTVSWLIELFSFLLKGLNQILDYFHFF